MSKRLLLHMSNHKQRGAAFGGTIRNWPKRRAFEVFKKVLRLNTPEICAGDVLISQGQLGQMLQGSWGNGLFSRFTLLFRKIL